MSRCSLLENDAQHQKNFDDPQNIVALQRRNSFIEYKFKCQEGIVISLICKLGICLLKHKQEHNMVIK